MATNYDKVKEFHLLFGHPVNTNLQTNILNDNLTIINFRQSLIKEEIDEYFEAFESKDIIGIADALGDMLYVIYGTFIVLGYDINKAFTNYLSYDKNKTMSNFELAKQYLEGNLLHRKTDILDNCDNKIYILIKNANEEITNIFDNCMMCIDNKDFDNYLDKLEELLY